MELKLDFGKFTIKMETNNILTTVSKELELDVKMDLLVLPQEQELVRGMGVQQNGLVKAKDSLSEGQENTSQFKPESKRLNLN